MFTNVSAETNVCVLEAQSSGQFLVVQGPKDGLLANLYDFPNVVLQKEFDETFSELREFMEDQLGLTLDDKAILSRKYAGSTLHIFSHIRRTMHVEHVVIKETFELDKTGQKFVWLTKDELTSENDGPVGVPATLKKALDLVTGCSSKKKKRSSPSKSESKVGKKTKIDSD
jgi:A/G-specific adenine glycosylase